ncbi:DUF397 domain-containing protein [Phytohabitans houttuyneae]|uniref:DUF397 domain-containing protein n=1 Tax=Phytohabitans houttuyneae TaxID=1076126 RepID=UPI00156546EA
MWAAGACAKMSQCRWRIGVRDSKSRNAVAFSFTNASWRSFIAGLPTRGRHTQ